VHPAEIEEIMKTLTCVVDNREQNTQKLRNRLKQIELPIERETVNVGDYTGKLFLPDGQKIMLPASVERKYAIDELCMCYCQQRGRFEREFKRAQEAGVRLWLLVEDATWEHIYSGKYRSQMRPKSLVGSILSYQARYDCRIVFCKEELSGKMIRDILHYEARELLERMVDE